jgi:hypothetical protein
MTLELEDLWWVLGALVWSEGDFEFRLMADKPIHSATKTPSPNKKSLNESNPVQAFHIIYPRDT